MYRLERNSQSCQGQPNVKITDRDLAVLPMCQGPTSLLHVSSPNRACASETLRPPLCLLPQIASPRVVDSGGSTSFKGSPTPSHRDASRPVVPSRTAPWRRISLTFKPLGLSNSVIPLVEHQVPVELPIQGRPRFFSPSPLIIKG